MPKNFVEEPFCVSESFCYRKLLGIREGGIKIFRRKVFVSQCRKFSRGTFQSFTDFGYRKILGINRKNIWQGSDSNPEPTAWEPCCPKPTAVICFWIKRVGNFGLKKKEKRPYWMNNFSCILHMRRKITNACHYPLNVLSRLNLDFYKHFKIFCQFIGTLYCQFINNVQLQGCGFRGGFIWLLRVFQCAI